MRPHHGNKTNQAALINCLTPFLSADTPKLNRDRFPTNNMFARVQAKSFDNKIKENPYYLF